MGTERDKGKTELEVFEQFCRVSQLQVNPTSIQKRAPPDPDIRCELHGLGEAAFELVELCDPNWARLASISAEKIPVYLRTSDPTSRIICKKLSRIYPQAIPVELLCYTRGRILTPRKAIEEVIAHELLQGQTIFRRVWLLHRGLVSEIIAGHSTDPQVWDGLCHRGNGGQS